MKTQVLQLDSHEDVISVRDRMSWSKTDRILLVFPFRSRLLTCTLDLRLLQRHADTLGAQLAIVTRSIELRRAANRMQIQAFKTVAAAQRQVRGSVEKHPRPHRRFERPDLYKMRLEAFPPEALWRSLSSIRLFFFSLAVLAILTVLFLFIPSASIQLSPATRLQSLSFTISANPDETSVNLIGSLPALLTKDVVEISKTVRTTGSVTIPDLRAQGQVRFRNLTTKLTGIPAGTVISTQGIPSIRFSTTMDTVLEADIGKTVDVPVQAVEAGSDGNLPADMLVALEEVDLGTSLVVTNPSPTSGGSDRTAAIQTVADRTLIHQVLLDELLDECKFDFQQTLSPGDIFFPDTLAVSQILSENYFPAEGISSDTLSLRMRLQCQVQFASKKDIDTLVAMSLDANLPEDFVPTSADITILPVSKPLTGADGITHLDLHAQRILEARLVPLAAVQLSLGRRPAGAVQRLRNSLRLTELPVIHVKPGWWPWLPIVPFRITVSIGG